MSVMLTLITGWCGCPDSDGEIIARAGEMYRAGDPEAGRWMTDQIIAAEQEAQARRDDPSAPAPRLAAPNRALTALVIWRVASQNPLLFGVAAIGLPLFGLWHLARALLALVIN